MASDRELDAMRRAILLSAFGLGTTSPNPPVGCVILDADGHLAGEGYHERKGEPHAEAHALAAAAERARGGTAVVTLEPCNHHGRTPPCRQALIEAGIARVVISVIDPTSRGEGGAAALQSAGIEVEVGLLAQETRLVLGPWLTAIQHKRPFVTLVYTVNSGGEIRSSLTPDPPSPEIMMDAYDLRIAHDAVLLNNGHLEEGRPGRHGSGVFNLPTDTADDTDDLLTSLSNGGIRSLLVDGTCPLAHSLFELDIVDQSVVYNNVSNCQSQDGCATIDFKKFSGQMPGFFLRDVTCVGEAVRTTCTYRRS